MLKLHKFGPAFGLSDASPFVMKVETYLRLSGQKYEAVNADVRKAPRAQLPVLEDEGKLVPDSSNIIEHLEGKRGEKMDAHLDARARAVAHAWKSMLEEHLYFGLLFMRWGTDEGWAVFEPTLKEMLGAMGVPGFMKGMVAKSARKGVVARASRQGIGRAPRAEVVARCNRIVDAWSELLGDSKFMWGDRPTTH